jgi:hypothetical protein
MVLGATGPEVALLWAPAGADEPGLRRLARDWTARRGPAVSRSYCFPVALVGSHGDRVGVDVERVVPCDRAFAESILAPGERAALIDGDDRTLSSVWASKEALAKALGDARRYDPRRLESPLLWPDGAAGPWRAAELGFGPELCAWVCWRQLSE